jgi:Ca2+-binding RTX toxin-like protein
MPNIIGSKGNDSIRGGRSLYVFSSSVNDETLIGGGGNDTFYDLTVFTTIISDFGGVGKGVNPSAAVIAEVDTLNFNGWQNASAKNLLLTQNGNNLEITFRDEFRSSFSDKVILQNFALENLDNLSKSTGATVDSGNILFSGQTTITDSFDVFNAKSTQSTIFNKNTVTFLNDLNNNVKGFDNSDDVINGQGGDDIIDGLSGNDLLRGGAGNNTLNGGTGDDGLNGSGTGDSLLNGDDGNDSLYASGYKIFVSYYDLSDELISSGNNTLNGGAGNDILNASGSGGNNLLSGGDGNDSLNVAGSLSDSGGYSVITDSRSRGNNTLDGGAGDDNLDASGSAGNNLLSGGDGNDSLNVSGFVEFNYDSYYNSSSSGNNTLNGGAGNDTLNATGSTGDNLLNGGDGNDFIYISSQSYLSYPPIPSTLVTQTVDGGKGDDLLSVDYSNNATEGITITFNPTTDISSIIAGSDRVNYNNIERFNILGTVYDDNIVGGNGNDTLGTGSSGNDTIDGGKGDDLLSVNYSGATEGVTTTFNATTNIGLITAGTNRVDYNNIERLNISGTAYNDKIVGNDGNDTLGTGSSGKDTIDGGKGDDVLSVVYIDATEKITTTFNATTNIGSITAGTNRVDYNNIERLNISGTAYNDKIVGNDGNDTLSGRIGDDTLTGGAGNDTFVFDGFYSKDGSYPYYDGTDTITDFGGVGKNSNPSVEVINSLDTLQFTSDDYFSAQILQLTQNGNNLEITFGTDFNGNGTKVILQNFKLENLDNLPANSSRPAIGNISFINGQTSVTDSFDVFDADSTQTNLFNKNTVTFLNDLNNNIKGFDNSNDVINGQRGDDIIDGLSGNDILRANDGNDTLIGGAGNDTLESRAANNNLDGGEGDDRLSISSSTGNNTLNGGTGNDALSISSSTGNNTLDGGEGDDGLSISGSTGDNLLSGGDGNDFVYLDNVNTSFLGNNTLNGGTGNDDLSIRGSKGDNLLSGGDGNDSLNIFTAYDDSEFSGNNTLEGGTGNDNLSISNSTGNNLLSGGDGNDTLTVGYGSTGDNLLDGGNGDDLLSANDSRGDNTLNGGAGDDRLNAQDSKGDNLLSGGDGNDFLDISDSGYNLPPTLGNNTLNGGAGDDTLNAQDSKGDNLLSGGDGNDYLDISENYKQSLALGDNTLNGGAGDDRLNAQESTGDNLLIGGDGNDILTGGNGNDSLYGGNGTDTFAFYDYEGGVNTIYDFNATNELIQVLPYSSLSEGLSIGSLQTSQFTIGTSATTSEELFIYNSATGALYFDKDGSATGFSQVQFAQLSTGLSLTNNNFVVG